MDSETPIKGETKVTEECLLEYIGGLHPDRDGLTVTQLEDLTTGWEAEIHCFFVDYEGDAGGVRRGRGSGSQSSRRPWNGFRMGSLGNSRYMHSMLEGKTHERHGRGSLHRLHI